MYQQGQRNTWS